MSERIDLTGRTFGRWTVLGLAKTNKKGATRWECVCSCGKIKDVIGTTLTRGTSVSCGCFFKEEVTKRSTKHGLSNHPLYWRWYSMNQRCENPKHQSYKHYGQRGITVCDEWKTSFMSFYTWSIENGFKRELELDRINNDGNYSPENCRWATRKKQNNNRRNNHYIEMNGETKTLTEWSEIYNINTITAYSRLKKGWSVEDAFTKPICKGA